jgi:hypothetical protein
VSADKQFDILIKYGLDKTKATEAVAEMRKVEAAAKQANTETTKGSEKATKTFGETNRAVQVLSGRLGQLGQVLQHVFNPALLGAAALGVAVRQVWNSFQTFLQGLKESGINAARSIGDIKGAILALDIERAKADANFKASVEDFDRATKRKIEVIGLEKAAVLELLAAREESDLASAGTPEERDAIKRRYASARGNIGAQATSQEIATQRAALDEKERMALARAAEGSRLSGGRTAERVALDLKNLPSSLKSLDESIAAQDEIIKKLEVITTPAGMLPYWNDPENFQAQLDAYKGAKVTRNALQRERDRVAGREVPLTQAASAYSAADALMAEVGLGREGLTNQSTDFAASERTRWQADAIRGGMGASAGLVANAAAGADAVMGGGRANADQAAAVAKLTQMLGLQNQNQATILQILGRMNDSEQSFQNALKVIKNQQ